MAWLLHTTDWKIPNLCIWRSLQTNAAPLCVSLSLNLQLAHHIRESRLMPAMLCVGLAIQYKASLKMLIQILFLKKISSPFISECFTSA